MGCSHSLNASTRQFHAEVDEPWLGLLRPDVGLSDYLSVLVRTYGLSRPFESACKYTPGLGQLIDLRHLTRAGLIAQDLIALGLTPAQVSSDRRLSQRSRCSCRCTKRSAGSTSSSDRRCCKTAFAAIWCATFHRSRSASAFLASYDDGHWSRFGEIVNAAGTRIEGTARDHHGLAERVRDREVAGSRPVDDRGTFGAVVSVVRGFIVSAWDERARDRIFATGRLTDGRALRPSSARPAPRST